MSETATQALTERAVAEAFAFRPASARAAGDHTADGLVGPVGADAIRRRIAQLARLEAELHDAGGASPPPAEAADLACASLHTGIERFRLDVLREPSLRCDWALDTVADISSYISRDYAPAADRATSLCAHLEALPGWLAEAASLLDGEVLMGPRLLAIDAASGYAQFYREDVERELGPLPDTGLAHRLHAALDTAATACDGYRRQVETLHPLDDPALGEERYCRMLALQEGVVESARSLRSRADAELERLTHQATEVAALAAPGATVDDAFDVMARSHSTAEGLLDDARGMLARLRDFWLASGAIDFPPDAECTVRPTPVYQRWYTAAYEPPGPLAPSGLPHFYYVTPVQPDWSAEQAEEWLRHLNSSTLENTSVHEAFPGHFVHELVGDRQPSLIRRVFWNQGFGEGWAHYTEQLAMEQGLAEGRPLLHLAQIQDALLRACRFRTSAGIHTEGWSVEDGTRLFMHRAHLGRLPAEREALRATHDPMYLLYTYGKLEILRWRETLSRRPGFDLRTFHARALGSGFPQLSVVRDLVLADGARA